jgi:hypothetical protein
VTACIPVHISASQIYYKYDGLNRLSRTCSVLPTDGERTDYALDAADNRQRYTNTKTDIALFPNGGSLNSGDGRFSLRFQADGNLVLYRNSDNAGLWGTNTGGSGANSAYFQPDGNLVLYKPDGGSVWNTGTYTNPCAYLSLQNDGNLVIYNMDGQAVWQSGTGGH